MANGTTWQVTGQLTDQSTITTAGQPITGTLVYYVTGLGNRGSVFVPDDQYNATHVAGMIAAAAAMLDQVSQLTDQSLSGM